MGAGTREEDSVLCKDFETLYCPRTSNCTARKNLMYGQRLAPCGTRDARTVGTEGRGLRDSRDADLVCTGARAMPETKFLDENSCSFKKRNKR